MIYDSVMCCCATKIHEAGAIKCKCIVTTKKKKLVLLRIHLIKIECSGKNTLTLQRKSKKFFLNSKY